MRIPLADYTFDGFRGMLSERPEKFRMMKIACFNTYFSSWSEQDKVISLEQILRQRGFRLKQMGDIKELEVAYRDALTNELISVKYYAYLSPENQTLRCFTDASSLEIEKTLNPLSLEPGLYHMWIGPVAFDQIKNSILSDYPHARVTFFSATRRPSVEFKGKIRPEVQRTIVYYGADGKEALEELRYYYGVVPSSIRFHIPGMIDLQINSRGVFTFEGGEMDFLLDFTDKVIEMALATRRVLESSKADTVLIKTARKELKIPYMIPWIVDFSQPLNTDSCEVLIEELSKNGFAIFNHVMIKGSLRFDATVADETKKSIFEVSATEGKMLISPRYETSFDSFLRFLEVVVENFDPNATCRSVLEV